MVRFAAFASLLALSLGQDRSRPPPRFRSGVDIILLDVTVLDKNRRPGISSGQISATREVRFVYR